MSSLRQYFSECLGSQFQFDTEPLVRGVSLDLNLPARFLADSRGFLRRFLGLRR